MTLVADQTAQNQILDATLTIDDENYWINY